MIGYMSAQVDERQVLDHYMKLLADAQNRQKEAAGDIASLTPIVDGMRTRLGIGARDIVTRPGNPYGSTPVATIGNAPNIMGTMRAIMMDGEERNTRMVMEELAKRNALPQGDAATKRRKVANRLYELDKPLHFLEKGAKRGMYRLRSQNGSHQE